MSDGNTKVSRRAFLLGAAAVSAGLKFGFAAGDANAASKTSRNARRSRLKVEKATQGGVKVDTPGRLGSEMRVCGWPNLVETANLAIKHFNEICDPNHSYVPYVGGTLGFKTPAFQHHRFDWIEVLPYPLLGRIVARRLTGNTEGQEIEVRQRRLLLAAFHNLDGFAYPAYVKGWSEDTSLNVWEQGRVMYALLAWFLESGDERLLSYVRGIVQGLMRASHKEGKSRVLNPGCDNGMAFGTIGPTSLVECLARYHEITGDPDAMDFCEGAINWILDPKTNFVDEKYRYSGFFRGCAAVIASVARFASYTNDTKLLNQAEEMFRSGLSLTSGYGATPENEPCCVDMELTTAALALTKAGRGEWWDMVDRHFRNQTVECQFTDPTAVNVGYVEGGPEPWDDTRDILKRSVGGFSWATPREHMFSGLQLMLCCGGHAMWTLGKIVESAVTEDSKGISVNLHFTLETPLASITSHEPFEGKIEVVPRRAGLIRVRKPSYATSVEALLNGSPVRPKTVGSYLVFDAVQAESSIVLSYPIPDRTTEEIVRLPGGGDWLDAKSDPVIGSRIQTTWRGNTVLAIDYADSAQPKHRLYLSRMERYKTGAGRNDSVRFFLPDRKLVW